MQADAGRREEVALRLGCGGAGGAQPSRAPLEVERDGQREREAETDRPTDTGGQEGT